MTCAGQFPIGSSGHTKSVSTLTKKGSKTDALES